MQIIRRQAAVCQMSNLCSGILLIVCGATVGNYFIHIFVECMKDIRAGRKVALSCLDEGKAVCEVLGVLDSENIDFWMAIERQR